jgi:polar amino acid transport system substrate-binding protein
MPWARALESLKNGQIDIISGAFKTPERQEFAHFSSIDEHSPNILFLRKGEEPKWALNSLADIAASTFKLGTQINVSYSREFDLLKEQEAFSKRLFTVSDRESLWKMLELKRVDGVIADKITGLIELKALGFKDKIVPSSLVISNDPSYFAFSKQTTSEEFVQQFDKMFSELISNGTINKIENLYINQ